MRTLSFHIGSVASSSTKLVASPYASPSPGPQVSVKVPVESGSLDVSCGGLTKRTSQSRKCANGGPVVNGGAVADGGEHGSARHHSGCGTGSDANTSTFSSGLRSQPACTSSGT